MDSRQNGRTCERTLDLAHVRPTRRFSEQFTRLPRPLREAVDDRMTLLAAQPRVEGTELRGNLRGIWKLYVDGHRILYRILGSQDQDVVLDSILYRPRGYPRHGARRPRSR
jgi:mRNA-degrading endonuclease RelE of RelBE toxin-antitoxin system